MTSPSKPWVAAVLTLIVPGAGHLYSGRPGKAVATFVLVMASWIVAFLLVLELDLAPINVVLGVAVFAAAFTIAAVSAFRSARDPSASPKHRFDRWYVILGVLVLFTVFVQPTYLAALERLWVQAFRIPNDTMAPTLRAGDYLLVKKSTPADLRRRLVVFRAPLPGRPMYLKRVVAGAGDTIEMSDKALKVNGRSAQDPYVQHIDPNNDLYSPAMYWQKSALAPGRDSASYRPTRDNWGPLIVPPDHVFVLGDNRDDSEDSRYWGFVPVSEIMGYPKRMYFAYRDGIRWERVGRDVSRW